MLEKGDLMIYNIIAVFIGGGLGAVLRYMVSYVSKSFFQMSILSTLTVNLLGCFLMGYVFGLTSDKIQTISPIFKVFITVGFLGGLTTFSTFSLEGFELFQGEKIGIALSYIMCSCVFGLLLVWTGYSLAKS